MGEYYIGQIILWAGKSLPKGWLPCDGRALTRTNGQNQALYAVIGDIYGGDAKYIFNIPNLNGRTVKQTQSPGNNGMREGTEKVTLLINRMPAHSHTVYAGRTPGDTNSPVDHWLACTNNEGGTEDKDYASTGELVQMGDYAISMEGQTEPFSVMQPYLGISYIICRDGLMPGRE
jgi:microcystin-dependent protein